MKKILFMIPTLAHGGAEKVLVNLVNNMDKNKYDITVQTLFDVGVNRQFLNKDICYKYCMKKQFVGNSQILKLFSPDFLFKHFVKEKYDVIISYLEGPTARIVSGCNDKDTKLVSWIHIEQHTPDVLAYSFKSFKEAKKCYNKFDKTVCVSEYVKEDFERILDFKKPIEVLYNTNETDEILKLSNENIDNDLFSKDEINICVVGKINKYKGCDRICRIQKQLKKSGFNTHIYFLGIGPEENFVKDFAKENDLENSITLLGYQTNPYKYVKKSDLFICASLAEGFSTAATEALILGTPVVTVEVSGMKEMLGDNNEYGIVTDNDENALYDGIKKILTENGLLEHYAKQAKVRGERFSTEKTVKAVEDMLESI